MDSNTHSGSRPDWLAALTADLDGLAAEDLDGLTDTARADRVMVLGGLADRLQGQWLKELAGVDARGAAGAEQGLQAGSTASWLRHRLRMGAGAAAAAVRTARALFGGPLTRTGQALVDGEISPAHAQVLAHGTQDLPDHLTAEAEPVLVEAARRLDPPRLRRVVAHLCLVADPEGAEGQAERHHQRRGLSLATTWEGMVAVDGLLEAEAGQIVLAALEPLARPADAHDTRAGGQRRADALVELARRNLEGGQLPQSGGVRPQLLVTVDLDSLLGHPGTLGGEAGGVGPLGPGGVPAAGLRQRGHPGPGHPPPHHPPPPSPRPRPRWPRPRRPRPRRPRRRWGRGGLAPDGGQAAPPSPGWRPHPTPGGRPDHPGRHRRPTGRPGRARRRLCGRRL